MYVLVSGVLTVMSSVLIVVCFIGCCAYILTVVPVYCIWCLVY